MPSEAWCEAKWGYYILFILSTGEGTKEGKSKDSEQPDSDTAGAHWPVAQVRFLLPCCPGASEKQQLSMACISCGCLHTSILLGVVGLVLWGLQSLGEQTLRCLHGDSSRLLGHTDRDREVQMAANVTLCLRKVIFIWTAF